MMSDRKITLSAYMIDLLSKGQIVFSDKQAQQALGISKGALLDAAEKQQRKKALFAPRRGFYVIVAPQFLSWGAPPPSWYIDPLMKHEGQSYYIGLLKAAELHGATHQAVMEFQVITDKRMPRIKAGRSAIGFYYRKDMEAVAVGLQDHKTDTGAMTISGPELTILDLMRYPRAAAGIDHIATVLADLGERIDGAHLAALSVSFERAVLQRLGYMLCLFGQEDKTDTLYKRISQGSVLPWVELDPALAADPDFSPEPVVRDRRWHVTVRRMPEPDE
jgi:predicted transcriptional regulator of viral defense system